MILFGHPYIPSEQMYHVESIEAIAHTPSNSIVAMEFDPNNFDIVDHLRLNKIRFALFIHSTVEAVLAENLGAAFLLVNPKEASTIQKVAEHYLFEAKVLGYCEEESDLETLIDLRLDGAIYPEALVKITS